MTPPSIRPLEPADLELICRHRLEMFRAMGRDEVGLAPMLRAFRAWLPPRLADGSYFGFIAEDAGRAIGGVGLMELAWPPHPAHPGDPRRGYVCNLFVEPQYRGRGVARGLMNAAESEFRRRGLGYAVLHASAAGRPLYERSGWSATSEMAKALGPQEAAGA
jgi:GNAT superfamily N-acetyltransferase